MLLDPCRQGTIDEEMSKGVGTLDGNITSHYFAFPFKCLFSWYVDFNLAIVIKIIFLHFNIFIWLTSNFYFQ